MPFFYYNKPTNEFEKEIQKYYDLYFDEITNKHKEVFENDLPNEMSNGFRGYGRLNQFNNHYHYFKVMLGTPDKPRCESHRYRTQILAVYLERHFNKDFEIHHDFSQPKDEFGKYNDKKTFIIYGDTKEEVKNIHQTFHTVRINPSKRVRGEIK